MEMLKQKEKILFYHEMMLYEDELHDNGISSCTIKIVSTSRAQIIQLFQLTSFLESNAEFLFHSVAIFSKSRRRNGEGQ